MKQQYADWIAANVKETLGRCAEATLAMAAAFSTRPSGRRSKP